MGNKPHHTSEGLNPMEVVRVIRLGVKAVRAPDARKAARYERAADEIVEKARVRRAEAEAETEARRKAKRKER